MTGRSDANKPFCTITYTEPSADFTWTGTGLNPTNWDDGGNWDSGTAPTSSDNCIIPASPAGGFPDIHLLNILVTYDCADLTIQSGAELTIRDGVEIDVSGNFSDAWGFVVVDSKLDVVGHATFSKGVTMNILQQKLKLTDQLP